MKMIPPVVIDGSMLVASSLPEDDYTPWNALTNYAAGTRCMLADVHRNYQRLVAGVSAARPDQDSVNWKDVGATNRFAMFDEGVGSSSSAEDSLSVTVAPGLVDSAALLDLVANTVTVTMTSAGTEVYRKEVNLNDNSNVYDGYTYFFEPIVMRTTVLLTDLPPYANGHVTVELDGSGDVSIGTLVVGRLFDMGPTRAGVGIGAIDYSGKTKDDFGVTTIVERPEARKLTVPYTVDNTRLDSVVRMLKSRRAKPSVWIGVGRYDSAIVYGYVVDRQILIPYDTTSECSVTIEELV